MTFTYSDAQQLRLTETRYGTIHDGKLWTLSYLAPHRHYHARDLNVFETAVTAFRFGP
ncbi:MAG: hypothetical protein J6386_05255 [Candidatus Synoicihabitans palmerolidicus]|nr:hypothetical protein [Candidatus Synoicihabitans palmerolidicus]